MTNILAVTDSTFEVEVLKSVLPVLVDFWAPWCGPCRALGPIVEDVANDYQGKVVFAKMNVDDNVATPSKFGVRGIPTLILFVNGAAVATSVGVLNKLQLKAFIDSNLTKSS